MLQRFYTHVGQYVCTRSALVQQYSKCKGRNNTDYCIFWSLRSVLLHTWNARTAIIVKWMWKILLKRKQSSTTMVRKCDKCSKIWTNNLLYCAFWKSRTEGLDADLKNWIAVIVFRSTEDESTCPSWAPGKFYHSGMNEKTFTETVPAAALIHELWTLQAVEVAIQSVCKRSESTKSH